MSIVCVPWLPPFSRLPGRSVSSRDRAGEAREAVGERSPGATGTRQQPPNLIIQLRHRVSSVHLPGPGEDSRDKIRSA
ncbi:hypothetical protein PoB_007443500 [Plakobranchus ocellatus]|uniref:Uncharacterized protein n=1 Tax=Plakobranchus ocellatus TaxID=259542 RepID=A0AAV4DVA8_9GAST|nr:hypothetical protein PoB_007443500 [Plakobranchus ocellatus]